jgi:hypothetical protein
MYQEKQSSEDERIKTSHDQEKQRMLELYRSELYKDRLRHKYAP